MIGTKDIEVDDDGDLVVDSNGDLTLSDTRRTTAQDVMMRIRTQLGEYKPSINFGSSVYTMEGEPNTKYNASLIQSMVVKALTYDARFAQTEFEVEVVPISIEEVLLAVVFRAVFRDVDSTDPLVVTFNFNYSAGTIEMIAGPDQLGSGALP